MSQTNPFPVRIDKDVLDSIKALAKKHNRSTNGEIEYALKQYIEAVERSNNNVFLSTSHS